MPTTAGDLSGRTDSSYPTETHSWTDDLPICRQSGVGYANNQVYREDGQRCIEHPFEETSIHAGSREDGSTFLYGVFDGHDGIEASQFTVQGLAAELLLDQLVGKVRDVDIKEALSQAFLVVEKNYLKSLDDKIAKRTSLQFQIPEGLNSYESYQKYPHIVEGIKVLNGELSCGTTAVVALVVGNKLYVANVGNSRALLCKTDCHGVTKVIQLSVDHDLSNEDELLRLDTIGLSLHKGARLLGNEETTRVIGNYLVKGAFREFEELAMASEEPVIAEPEIQGGVEIDESCSFLLLMTDGIYKSLEEATGTTQVNKDIVGLAVAEFREQSTLTGVAQAVVDKIVRLHTDAYMSGAKSKLRKRDDMTLLVRNFNFPMATSHRHVSLPPGTDCKDTMLESESTNSSSTRASLRQSLPTEIPAYVDFTDFYQRIEEARENGTLPDDIDV